MNKKLKRELAIKKWYAENEDIEKKALAKVDELLSQGTKEAYLEISTIFDHEISIEDFKTENDMSYLIQAINIFFIETEHGIKNHIFTHAASMKELIAFMNHIRFLIWRFEFAGDEYAKEDLREFVIANNVSEVVKYYILKVSSWSPEETAKRLF